MGYPSVMVGREGPEQVPFSGGQMDENQAVGATISTDVQPAGAKA